MKTTNCTFCKKKIRFGMVDEHLKVIHAPPHCPKFTELSQVEFLKQSVSNICDSTLSLINHRYN